MKKMVNLVWVALVLVTVSLSAVTVQVDDYVAGRIRFVEGDSAVFTFSDKQVSVSFDYLVLLGASFSTEESRIELSDINRNLYWFDRQSSFHFESVDTEGEKTALFLGKGSFVAKTENSFSMVTGAGSIYFPAHGRYLVVKNAFGKDKVYVTTLEGETPSIIKKAGVFNRLKLDAEAQNVEIVTWADQKELDWKATLRRANVFSNVGLMSPYVAGTQKDGSLSWVKISYVKPYTRATDMISGNDFYPIPSRLHAYGMEPGTYNMTDFELAMWFEVNKINAVKWTWNVEKGWHASYYFDPLSGFGAQYSRAGCGIYSYSLGWHRFFDPLYYATGGYVKSHLVDEGELYMNRLRSADPFSVRKPVHIESAVTRQLTSSSSVKLRMTTDVKLTRASTVARLNLIDRQVSTQIKDTARYSERSGRSLSTTRRQGNRQIKPVKRITASPVNSTTPVLRVKNGG